MGVFLMLAILVALVVVFDIIEMNGLPCYCCHYECCCALIKLPFPQCKWGRRCQNVRSNKLR